ncbi:MAG: cytochrome c5 family protein [Gammaproteobacteria bacterium]|jgi:cytochrome c5|nr:cytochrome c5 family protein [Gammaproteobacteria bacterium]
MNKLTNVISASLLLSLSGAVLADGGAPGQQVYQKSCQACHATGAAGAPKLGDKDAWAPRIATGTDALVASSINGKGVMPPKGACASCSDDDLRAAVEYMVSQSK